MHENQHKPGDTFMPANQKVVSPPVAPAAASNVPQSPLPSTPPPPTTAVAPAVATTQLPTPPIPLSPPASQSAPSPYAVPAPTPVVGSVKTKRKMRTLLLSIAAVVLFGGAGAFAYLGVYLPNKPENVVGQAFLNLISVDSLQYEGKSSFSGGLFSGNLEFKGGSSQSTSKFTFGATLDFGDDSIELNLRGIDKKLYLQIGKSDALASLLGGVLGGGSKEFQSSIGQLLASISQQWYEIKGDEFGQDFSVTPDLDEEQQQQISDTLKSHKLFDITAVHEDESIKDQNTKHYTLLN